MTQSGTAYDELLLEYRPRPIRSESECRRVRRALERLMKPHPSRAESEIVEVLATLVEQYESREHPSPDLAPRDLLAHLMDARGVSRAELARATRIPRSTVTNVLTGKREPSKGNIRDLAEYFGVSPVAFLGESRPKRLSRR